MNDETMKRFQISILDMETAEIVIVDTDQYFLSHEDKGEVVVRTERVKSEDALVTVVALKRMIYETLKKELVSDEFDAPPEQLNALFNEVFDTMFKRVIEEPVEIADGGLYNQGRADDNDT